MRDTDFYSKVLGLESPWEVTAVDLDMENGLVNISVDSSANKHKCPECNAECSIYDHAPMRRWRHLDTCQLQTIINCRLPRVSCQKCGVKTVPAAWAEPHGRFTLMFEWCVIQWLQASQNQSQVAKRLNLSFDEVHGIMARAVARGMAARKKHSPKRIGIDEKSMKRGHHYLSVLNDLDRGVVLDVVEHRKEESAKELLNTLDKDQKQNVKAICMDMWGPFMKAAESELDQAEIVHDRFHISQHLNEAVDKTRRAEHKALLEKGIDVLKGTKYLFLRAHESLRVSQLSDFYQAKDVAEKTAAVWESKELFKHFFSLKSVSQARTFLARWWMNARKKRIRQLDKVANMILRHAKGIINYVSHRITNAMAESINGRIQQLKVNARGFLSFKHYRNNILFYFAGLDLNPLKSQ